VENNNVKFFSPKELKSKLGIEGEFKVLLNKKTKKIFLSTPDGEAFRCQQDIDKTKEMKFMVIDDNFSDPCLVNVNGGAEELFTL